VTPHFERVSRYAEKYGLPIAWPFAVIRQESLGNPNAKSKDGGLGLMQITSRGVKQGYADDQIMNPDLNVDLGCHELARVRKSYSGATYGLPEVASMYNAGETIEGFPHLNEGTNPAFQSRWGMRCSTGYIDSVVQANNSYILMTQKTA